MQPSALSWTRSGADWLPLSGRKRMGRVVADSKYRGMYRIELPSGRLSDMANLSWAKSLALDAAEREITYETANTPRKPQQNAGSAKGKSPPARLNEAA
jgi:hypothetical protein